MKGKCRICLLKYQNMVQIFETDNAQDLEISIADMISESTGFPVGKGDFLPEYICRLCLRDMQSSFRARNTYVPNQQFICQVKEEIIEEEEDYNEQEGEENYDQEPEPFVCHVKNEPLEEDFVQDDVYKAPDIQMEQYNGPVNETTIGEVNDEGPIKQELPFKCTLCPERFRTKYFLDIHKNEHMTEQVFPCDHCTKTFRSARQIRNHMLVHTGKRAYKCPQCPKSFLNSSNLQSHLRIHTGERPYNCSKCFKTFIQKSHLVNHERTHTGERPFKCSKCDRSFIQPANLQSHIKSHCKTSTRPQRITRTRSQAQPEKAVFNCTHCSEFFDNQDALIDHMHTHNALFEEEVKCQMSDNEIDPFNDIEVDIFEGNEKDIELDDTEEDVSEENDKDFNPHDTDDDLGDSKRVQMFKCPLCPKVCRRRNDFKVHQRNHFEQQCPYCSKVFNLVSNFKRHMRIHTKEKTLTCAYCPKTFRIPAQLREHTRTHTGERPFQCPECLQSFTYNSVLKKHMRTHTGERPYRCNECKKSYLQLDHLKLHIQRHNKEEIPIKKKTKEYKCSDCEKIYRTSRSLRRHMLIHDRKKEFNCTDCSESDYLAKHIARRHEKKKKDSELIYEEITIKEENLSPFEEL
nr:zinc finger protein 436-like [Drosophila takahashii]